MRTNLLLGLMLALMVLSVPAANAGDLTFIVDATNPSNGKKFKAYIDQSTIHQEGVYRTVKLVSIYEQPISAAGFAGVKSMVNVFQIDCLRHVKRVTYIGFRNTQEQVIVEEKYPNAKDEPLGVGTVDQKIQLYFCDLPM